MGKLLILVLFGLVLFNIFASLNVFTNSITSKSQRIAQLPLIWLFPFFGAVGCISFLSSEPAYDQSTINRSAFIENGGANDIFCRNHSGSGDCSGGGGGDGD